MVVDLIGVPFSSTGRTDGIADALGVLRERGLTDCLAASVELHDAGDLALEGQTTDRTPGRLCNESGVISLFAETRAAVGDAITRGNLPLLVGGDCPVILGALAALGDPGELPGLLMIDGHEDAYPPSASPTGEASDSELGIALGQFKEAVPAEIAQHTPLIAAESVALVGPRDRRELAANEVPSLAERVWLRTDQDVRREGPVQLGRHAIAAVAQSSRRWWLHVDLDALSTHDFPAADYLQPGGLTWDELEVLVAAGLGDPGCAGCSVVIYNPDLDPDRSSAERIIDFLGGVLGN